MANDPLLSQAIADSSDIVLELAGHSSGRTVLAFYIALLRLAKTMERLHPDLRRVRDPVLEVAGEGRGVN